MDGERRGRGAGEEEGGCSRQEHLPPSSLPRPSLQTPRWSVAKGAGLAPFSVEMEEWTLALQVSIIHGGDRLPGFPTCYRAPKQHSQPPLLGVGYREGPYSSIHHGGPYPHSLFLAIAFLFAKAAATRAWSSSQGRPTPCP